MTVHVISTHVLCTYHYVYVVESDRALLSAKLWQAYMYTCVMIAKPSFIRVKT